MDRECGRGLYVLVRDVVLKVCYLLFLRRNPLSLGIIGLAILLFVSFNKLYRGCQLSLLIASRIS